MYKMEVFSICWSGLAFRNESTFGEQKTKKIIQSQLLQLERLQLHAQFKSPGYRQMHHLSLCHQCSSQLFRRVSLSTPRGQDGQIFASTLCQALKQLFHTRDVGIPNRNTWKIFEVFMNSSACAGCKNFWKCNSEGLSALNFGLSAMSLGRCARLR